ncbi:hypothetical protein J3F84DRAFT_385360 [Trichoderma pleuroticola]
MPAFASHHNRSPREKGRGTPSTKEGGPRKRPSSWYKRTHHPPASRTLKPETEPQAGQYQHGRLNGLSSPRLAAASPSFQRCARRYSNGLKPASWPHSLPLLLPYLAGQDTHTYIHTHSRHAGEQTRTQTATRMMGLPYRWAHRWAHRSRHGWMDSTTWLASDRPTALPHQTQTKSRPGI